MGNCKRLVYWALVNTYGKNGIAVARITGGGVILSGEQVKKPVAVRYAFKDWVAGDLFNTEGLPAAPFRTDTWEVK